MKANTDGGAARRRPLGVEGVAAGDSAWCMIAWAAEDLRGDKSGAAAKLWRGAWTEDLRGDGGADDDFGVEGRCAAKVMAVPVMKLQEGVVVGGDSVWTMDGEKRCR